MLLTVAIVGVGIYVPFSPLAAYLGFVGSGEDLLSLVDRDAVELLSFTVRASRSEADQLRSC